MKPTNMKKRELDTKWWIPLNNVNVQLRETKEQISMGKKMKMNELDKEIVELNQKILKLDPKKDRRQRNKFIDNLQKRRIDRLKISQTVPLEIKNCQDGKEMKPHRFMFSRQWFSFSFSLGFILKYQESMKTQSKRIRESSVDGRNPQRPAQEHWPHQHNKLRHQRPDRKVQTRRTPRFSTRIFNETFQIKLPKRIPISDSKSSQRLSEGLKRMGSD